jgi:NAD(P)-dependent dehydrogenase (short-subunit alcohol dehydrogenase family)
MQQQKIKQNVLITGASSGIGRVTAQLFAREGFRVFGTSRQQHPDEDGIEMLVADVCSDNSVEHCVAEVRARTDRIDVLVNNAGVWQVGIAEETSLKDAHEVLETNFFGVVRMIKAVLPRMRSQRQGRIINVGSLAAWVGEPGEAFYAASKHALAGYTEALRHEVWPLGIHVSLVEPGAYKTSILQGAFLTEGTIADYDAVRQTVYRTLRSALQQGGDPDKIAHLLLKVARSPSPRLRYEAGREAFLPYLKVLLPQRLFDILLRRGYGLGKAESQPVTSDDK